MSLATKTRDDYVFRGAETFRVLINQPSTGLLLIQSMNVDKHAPGSAFWIDYDGYPATPPPPPFTAEPVAVPDGGMIEIELPPKSQVFESAKRAATQLMIGLFWALFAAALWVMLFKN